TCIFFFQAEDGIRDRNVTGVQTCALPISLWRIRRKRWTRSIICLVFPTVCHLHNRYRIGSEWHSEFALRLLLFPIRLLSLPLPQIGRASCRERAVVLGVALAVLR